jgi:hypothetical protein
MNKSSTFILEAFLWVVPPTPPTVYFSSGVIIDSTRKLKTSIFLHLFLVLCINKKGKNVFLFSTIIN